MASSFREQVIERALRNRPSSSSDTPRFGTFQWRAQTSSSAGVTNPEVSTIFSQTVIQNNVAISRLENFDVLIAMCQDGVPPYRYVSSLSSFPSGITFVGSGNEARVRGFINKTLSTFQFNLTAYDSTNKFLTAGPISLTVNEASFERRFPYWVVLSGANESSTNCLYYRLSNAEYGVHYQSFPRPSPLSTEDNTWPRYIFAPNKGIGFPSPNRNFWHIAGTTSGPSPVYYVSNLSASDYAPVNDLTNITWSSSAASSPVPVSNSIRTFTIPRYIKIDGGNDLGTNNLYFALSPGTTDVINITSVDAFNDILYYGKGFTLNYDVDSWIAPPYKWNQRIPSWRTTTISISVRLSASPTPSWKAPVDDPSIKWTDNVQYIPITATSLSHAEVPAKPVIASVAIPFMTATSGQNLNFKPVVPLSGEGPFQYTAVNLPVGFTINSSTGFLSGRPTSSTLLETRWYQIKITDLGTNYSSIGSFQMTMSAYVPPLILDEIDHYFTFGNNPRYRQTDIRNINKINSYGVPDTSFNFPVSGATNTVVSVTPVQNNTKWLIHFNGNNYYPGARSNIIRLNRSFNSTNPFGSLDNTFNVSGSGVNAVSQIVENPDSSYYLIGDSVEGYNGVYGFDKIVRIKSNGDIDTSFSTTSPDVYTPNVSAFQITGGSFEYLLGGLYLSGSDLGEYNGKAIWANFYENDPNPLNTIGWDDLYGTGNLAWEIYDIAAGYGKYYNPTDTPYPWVGSWISRVGGQPITTTPVLTTYRTYVTDGFTPYPASGVFRMRGCTTSNSKAIVTGEFNGYRGSTCNRIARLNSDGTFDSTFNTSGSGLSVSPIQVLRSKSGFIYLITLKSGAWYNDFQFNHIVRISENGSRDQTFTCPPISGSVSELTGVVEQEDGKLLVYGYFTNVNGSSRRYIARLNVNGSLDSSFIPPANIDWPPDSLTTDRKGNVFFFGQCTGTPYTSLVLLNSAGNLIDEFNPCTGFSNTPPFCPGGVNGVIALTALPGIPHEPLPCNAVPVYALYSANFVPINVTLSGNRYRFDQFNSTTNPTITCFRGTNYDFIVNTPGQPFALRTTGNAGPSGTYNNDPINGKTSGTIMYTPVESQTSPIFYQSTTNPSISGLIIIKSY